MSKEIDAIKAIKESKANKLFRLVEATKMHMDSMTYFEIYNLNGGDNNFVDLYEQLDEYMWQFGGVLNESKRM